MMDSKDPDLTKTLREAGKMRIMKNVEIFVIGIGQLLQIWGKIIQTLKKLLKCHCKKSPSEEINFHFYNFLSLKNVNTKFLVSDQ